MEMYTGWSYIYPYITSRWRWINSDNRKGFMEADTAFGIEVWMELKLYIKRRDEKPCRKGKQRIHSGTNWKFGVPELRIGDFVCLSLFPGNLKGKQWEQDDKWLHILLEASFPVIVSLGFSWSDSRGGAIMSKWHLMEDYQPDVSMSCLYFCSMFWCSCCPFTLWGLAWKWIPLMGTIISLRLLQVVLLIHWTSYSQRMNFLR